MRKALNPLDQNQIDLFSFRTPQASTTTQYQLITLMMLSRWLSAARRACADNSLAASQRRWLSQLTPADTQHAASPGGILQAYNR